MVFNVHAGHNSIVPGAAGCFSEVTEDRKVKDLVIKYLRNEGHTVYDCTDDVGNTSLQNLANIVTKCNSHKVDYDISIHFNAFNGTAHGVEVCCYNNGTADIANRICSKISSLGFTNRGVKYHPEFYVLRNTNAQAFLIECCFCDSKTDANIYNADKMARAIVEGILNCKLSTNSQNNTVNTVNNLYRVRKNWNDAKSQIGAYSSLENAKKACKTGYSVYDWNGKEVYSNNSQTKTSNSFMVKVEISNLHIRSGAGTGYANKGYIKPGIYTIVETKTNGGYTWGRLKSGAGWIALEFTKRV